MLNKNEIDYLFSRLDKMNIVYEKEIEEDRIIIRIYSKNAREVFYDIDGQRYDELEIGYDNSLEIDTTI